jgi:segregation and condensation protein B
MTDENKELASDEYQENEGDTVVSTPVDDVTQPVPDGESDRAEESDQGVEDADDTEIAARIDDVEEIEVAAEPGVEPEETPAPAHDADEPDDEAVGATPEEDDEDSLLIAADEGATDSREIPETGEAAAPTVESVIEAILFATDEPLTDSRLANTVETTTKQVRECIQDLNAQYETNNNAFRIEQIAGGYQMLTLPAYNHWLKRMLRTRSDTKLSPAALETLAIVAYKQPIIRADIEAIRGVAVGEVIRSLMYKGLVKIVGRAEILGRPMLYGTTKKFLGVFGLNSLKDLPQVEELKKPD